MSAEGEAPGRPSATACREARWAANCHLWVWCQLPSLVLVPVAIFGLSGALGQGAVSSHVVSPRRAASSLRAASLPLSTILHTPIRRRLRRVASNHTHPRASHAPPSLPLRRSLTLVLRLYSAAYACRRASTLRHMRRGGACPIGRAPPPTDRLVLVSLLYPTHTTVRPLGAPHASPVATSIGPPPRERGTPPPREKTPRAGRQLESTTLGSRPPLGGRRTP